MSTQWIYGHSPPDVSKNCTTLEFVDFTANNIVADLKECFGERHPRQLQMLAFRQNLLFGTLLTDQREVFFCNYTRLYFLDLSNNAFHGGLSKCFWDMPHLSFVDLTSNSFSGTVPFSRMCSLSYLHLANNHFKGTFPLVLKECKDLITLDLGGNSFSGAIPSWVSKSLPELKFLRLSSNMFDGAIPHEIVQFRFLQLLDLSKNKLAGPLPNDFANFTAMTREQKTTDYVYASYYMHPQQIQIVWKNVDHVYTIMMIAEGM